VNLDGDLQNRIKFYRISSEWESALAEFFADLKSFGTDRVFHPHPFDAAEARRRATYTGGDEYHIAARGSTIVAYGMLRGWDEGYVTPSLGIAVHPEWQGRGIGRSMMEHLHHVARARGATRIRLKVYPANEVGIRLYESFGYDFAGEEHGQRVGVLTL
jgi:[ribosomal protein S18]-alanine N-acetyltransferase